MTVRASLVFLLLAGIAATAGDHARADQVQQTVDIGNKKLELVSTGDSRTQAKIDGDVVEEDAFIQVATSFSDGDTGAAEQLVSEGGNGCPGKYVVVSEDAKGKVTATDPFGTCSDTAETSVANGTITVRFVPTGGQDGTIYHWSFAKGLEPPVTEPFKPKTGTSWETANDLIG